MHIISASNTFKPSAVAVLVSDDLIQRQLVSDLLAREGLEVRAFESATAALEGLDRQSPLDLIVTELYMPGIDGWGFCRLLRSPEYAPFNRVPILVVSATFTGEEVARVTADLGANAFLACPVEGREFGEQVRMLLRGEYPQHFLRVLIVEDDETQAGLLEEVFAAQGYRVDIALTGREAEQKFGAGAPDVVILDHHLPDTRGDQLLLAFKQQRPDTVYLAMTGDPRPELALEWMKQGAAAYVTKPFAPQYLIELCAKARRERSLMRLEDRLQARTRELRQSEERLRLAHQATNDVVWDWDLVNDVLRWSESGSAIFGWTDIVERPQPAAWRLARVHPEDRQRVNSGLRAVVDNPAARHWHDEYRFQKVDGVYAQVMDRGQVLRNAQGQALRMIGALFDVTERKRTEEALRQSQELFAAFMGNLPAAAFVKDAVGRTVFVNRYLEELLSFQHWEGKTTRELLAGEMGQQMAADDRKALAEGPLKIQETMTDSHGVPRTFETIKFPIRVEGSPVLLGGIAVDITARQQAKATLAESELRYRTLADSGQALVWTSGLDKRCDYFNRPWLDFTGRALEQELGDGWAEGVHPEDLTRCVETYTQAFDRRQPFSMVYRLRRHDGVFRWIQDDGSPRYDSRRVFLGFIGHCLDVTERKRAEEEREKLQAQLTHAQKMESVGRLAGGVAHDFNNMLQAILGNVALALTDLPPNSPSRENLEEIHKCAQRSAELTRQLLAFARKQTVMPRVLDLNATVEGMLKMLRRLIGEDIDLAWLPARDLWPVKIDPSQLDQVLANLCVNARDAITGVGKVTLETENTVFDEAFCATRADVVPGEYVLLAVSDNGCGMDKELLGHLFEPFFTTKGVGRGTGLGLATVYGIVKQNQGFISAYSEPGHGTTFKLYLPRHVGNAAQNQKEGPAQPASRGQETILLVEDEPAVLLLGRRALESLGYTVLVASTPGEAIGLAELHAGEIHLLMTDVVMPEMNGRDLATRLLSLYPNLKRLFMSGYTAEVIAHHGVLDEGVHFLQKPFTVLILAEKVREALEVK